jgi:hypothetical protein
VVEEKTFTIDEIQELTGFDRRTVSYYVQEGLLPKVGRRGPKTRYSQLFLNRLLFIRKIRDLQDRGATGTMTLTDFRGLFRSVPAETIAEILEGREPVPVIGQERPEDRAERALPSERRRTVARVVGDLRRSVAEEAVSDRYMSVGRPMDAEQEHLFEPDYEEIGADRADFAMLEPPAADEDGAARSGKGHRLTVDAIERDPDAPKLDRPSAPPPPVGEELREALTRLSAVVTRRPRAHLRTTETWTRTRITEDLALSARGLDERHLPLLERVAQILRRLTRDSDV